MNIADRQKIALVGLIFAFMTVLVACSSAPPTQTQTSTQVQSEQASSAKTATDIPGPTTGSLMTKEYVQTIGRMDYIWGCAMVNSHKGTRCQLGSRVRTG